jgi:hypothetical protein
MSAEITRYFQAARAEACDRIPLFRLAWDTAVSAFGSRQVPSASSSATRSAWPALWSRAAIERPVWAASANS